MSSSRVQEETDPIEHLTETKNKKKSFVLVKLKHLINAIGNAIRGDQKNHIRAYIRYIFRGAVNMDDIHVSANYSNLNADLYKIIPIIPNNSTAAKIQAIDKYIEILENIEPKSDKQKGFLKLCRDIFKYLKDPTYQPSPSPPKLPTAAAQPVSVVHAQPSPSPPKLPTAAAQPVSLVHASIIRPTLVLNNYARRLATFSLSKQTHNTEAEAAARASPRVSKRPKVGGGAKKKKPSTKAVTKVLKNLSLQKVHKKKSK